MISHASVGFSAAVPDFRPSSYKIFRSFCASADNWIYI